MKLFKKNKKNNIDEKDKPQKKCSKKKKIIIIVIIVLILLGGLGTFFIIKNNKAKKETKHEITHDYLEKGYRGECQYGEKSITTISYEPEKGDKIICTFGWEGVNTSSVEFEIEKGSGVNLIKADSEDGNVTIDQNKVSLELYESQPYIQNAVEFELEITNPNNEKDLYFRIKNINGTRPDKDTYSYTDESDLKFNLFNKDVIYIQSQSDGALTASTYHDYEYDDYDKYECENFDCFVLDNENEDYFLFYDGKIYLYNYEKKDYEKTALRYEDNKSYTILTDAEKNIAGYIVDDFDEWSHHSILYNASGKIVINNKTALFYYDDYKMLEEYYDTNEDTRILGYDGKIYKANTKDIKRIGNSEFYTFADEKMDYYEEHYLFDSKGNALFGGHIISFYSFDDDGNIVIAQKSQKRIATYNKNLDLIKEISNVSGVVNENYYVKKINNSYSVFNYSDKEEVYSFNLPKGYEKYDLYDVEEYKYTEMEKDYDLFRFAFRKELDDKIYWYYYEYDLNSHKKETNEEIESEPEPESEDEKDQESESEEDTE